MKKASALNKHTNETGRQIVKKVTAKNKKTGNQADNILLVELLQKVAATDSDKGVVEEAVHLLDAYT